MRNRLIALALVGLAGQALAGSVFISEYIETNLGNNKAIELYNASAGTVDMSNYAIWRISNGGDWIEGQSNAVTFSVAMPELQTDLMVGPGETFTIVNSLATLPELLSNADVLGTSATFMNGDDAIGLAVTTDSGATWTLIDAVGEAGPDPGAGWTVSGVANGTVDRTLVRLPAVCDGTTIWAVCQDQWTVYPNLTMGYFGNHTAFCGGGNAPPVIGAIAYSPNPLTPAANVTFNATITDSDGTVTLAMLYYGTTPGSLTNSVPLNPVGGDHFVSSAPVVAPDACQNLYFRVEATDDDAAVSATGELTAPVECVLTIAQIQGGVDPSPYAGMTVTTEGQITFVQSATSMFIQDGNGPWNGIQVFGPHPGVLDGDLIRVTGSVLEYNGFTEIAGSLSIQVLASPGPLSIVPELITVSQAVTEAYESVLVRVENTTCVSASPFLVFDGNEQILVYFPAFIAVEDECYDVTGVRYAYQGTVEIVPRTIDEISICAVVDAPEVVGVFSLGQAYPNPFNPTAQISFSMDQTAPARLSVFNLVGQEVAVLVDGVLEIGRHEARFDAAGLPSGLYLYNLQSEGRQLTGRMLLVR